MNSGLIATNLIPRRFHGHERGFMRSVQRYGMWLKGFDL